MRYDAVCQTNGAFTKVHPLKGLQPVHYAEFMMNPHPTAREQVPLITTNDCRTR